MGQINPPGPPQNGQSQDALECFEMDRMMIIPHLVKDASGRNSAMKIIMIPKDLWKEGDGITVNRNQKTEITLNVGALGDKNISETLDELKGMLQTAAGAGSFAANQFRGSGQHTGKMLKEYKKAIEVIQTSSMQVSGAHLAINNIIHEKVLTEEFFKSAESNGFLSPFEKGRKIDVPAMEAFYKANKGKSDNPPEIKKALEWIEKIDAADKLQEQICSGKEIDRTILNEAIGKLGISQGEANEIIKMSTDKLYIKPARNILVLFFEVVVFGSAYKDGLPSQKNLANALGKHNEVYAQGLHDPGMTRSERKKHRQALEAGWKDRLEALRADNYQTALKNKESAIQKDWKELADQGTLARLWSSFSLKSGIREQSSLREHYEGKFSDEGLALFIHRGENWTPSSVENQVKRHMVLHSELTGHLYFGLDLTLPKAPDQPTVEISPDPEAEAVAVASSGPTPSGSYTEETLPEPKEFPIPSRLFLNPGTTHSRETVHQHPNHFSSTSSPAFPEAVQYLQTGETLLNQSGNKEVPDNTKEAVHVSNTLNIFIAEGNRSASTSQNSPGSSPNPSKNSHDGASGKQNDLEKSSSDPAVLLDKNTKEKIPIGILEEEEDATLKKMDIQKGISKHEEQEVNRLSSQTRWNLEGEQVMLPASNEEGPEIGRKKGRGEEIFDINAKFGGPSIGSGYGEIGILPGKQPEPTKDSNFPTGNHSGKTGDSKDPFISPSVKNLPSTVEETSLIAPKFTNSKNGYDQPENRFPKLGEEYAQKVRRFNEDHKLKPDSKSGAGTVSDTKDFSFPSGSPSVGRPKKDRTLEEEPLKIFIDEEKTIPPMSKPKNSADKKTEFGETIILSAKPRPVSNKPDLGTSRIKAWNQSLNGNGREFDLFNLLDEYVQDTKSGVIKGKLSSYIAAAREGPEKAQGKEAIKSLEKYFPNIDDLKKSVESGEICQFLGEKAGVILDVVCKDFSPEDELIINKILAGFIPLSSGVEKILNCVEEKLKDFGVREPYESALKNFQASKSHLKEKLEEIEVKVKEEVRKILESGSKTMKSSPGDLKQGNGDQPSTNLSVAGSGTSRPEKEKASGANGPVASPNAKMRELKDEIILPAMVSKEESESRKALQSLQEMLDKEK
jgi:hypothetical protein